ncbi:MAG: hypothetical protein OXB84_06425, partial [Halobacteriovoraceae bacterium]|nr:hypothetical protein [Halobacteriovoraceae bacterium]
ARRGYRRETLGSVHGKSMLITLKKRLPFSFLNRPSIGIEYFTADKNFFSPTLLGSSEDATGFYSTMGNARHYFYLQPLEDELSLRLGYRVQNIKHKSDSSKYNLGTTLTTNENIYSYYLSLLLFF